MLIVLHVEVEREEGLNAAREAVEQAVVELIDGESLSVSHGDYESSYAVVSVEAVEPPKAKRRRA